MSNLLISLLFYFVECFGEEGIFRLVLMSFLMSLGVPALLTVLIAAVLYGLSHFILFKLKMVLASAVLGIVLGLIFLLLSHNLALAYFVCSIVHFFAGVCSIQIGFTHSQMREAFYDVNGSSEQ